MRPPVEIELSLPRDASAPAVARHALGRSLTGEIDARSASDLMLIVSELVSNALEHGHGEIRMRLRLTDGKATGEVVDDGRGFERQVRDTGLNDVRGRGLLMLDALSTRWGIHEGTTHVWFEIDLQSPADASPGPALGQSQRPPELPDP